MEHFYDDVFYIDDDKLGYQSYELLFRATAVFYHVNLNKYFKFYAAIKSVYNSLELSLLCF